MANGNRSKRSKRSKVVKNPPLWLRIFCAFKVLYFKENESYVESEQKLHKNAIKPILEDASVKGHAEVVEKLWESVRIKRHSRLISIIKQHLVDFNRQQHQLDKALKKEKKEAKQRRKIAAIRDENLLQEERHRQLRNPHDGQPLELVPSPAPSPPPSPPPGGFAELLEGDDWDQMSVESVDIEEDDVLD